jgi:hypothetical protein
MKELKSVKGALDIFGLLLILLLFGFFGAAPFWGYSHSWGYGPSGFMGIILLIVLLKVLGVIS